MAKRKMLCPEIIDYLLNAFALQVKDKYQVRFVRLEQYLIHDGTLKLLKTKREFFVRFHCGSHIDFSSTIGFTVTHSFLVRVSWDPKKRVMTAEPVDDKE